MNQQTLDLMREYDILGDLMWSVFFENLREDGYTISGAVKFHAETYIRGGWDKLPSAIY